ncbi:MAG: hypothetical protein JXB32_24225 [Deltaproteobacteria bacterium]|nr:hypothetical protein [Deltaproteobacteria bacterium]
MKDEGQPVQLIDLFALLAERADAEAAVPLRDGSLLYRLHDGERTVDVFHSPWRRPGGRTVKGAGGCFFVRGAADGPPADRLRRLAGLRMDFPLSLDLLSAWRNADAPVTLGADFARLHLSPFLLAGRTAWGPFLFAGCDARGRNAADLVFEARAGRVVFRVRPAHEARGDGWRRIGPLAVRIASDGRDPGTTATLPHRVENYLYYALHRSFRPGQPLAGAKGAPAERDARGDRCTDTAGEGVRDLPDETIRENLDEVAEHAFFLEPFLRRIGTQETLGTLLDADEGLALVVHTERECTTKLPWLKGCEHFRYIYSRLTPLPTCACGRAMEWLEPPQAETILGDEAGLLQALRKAASRKGTRIVALMGTCVGDVTGLDYEGLAAAVERDCSKPVVVINQMLEDFVEMDRTWEMLMRIADRARAPEPGRINLVGYAPAESDLADELRAVLPRLGLRLNALLVPSFRSQQALDFTRAACTVLNPARSYGFEFSRAAERFGDMKFHRLSPPFGKSATVGFYRGLAALAGRKDPAADAAELWSPHEASFAGWRERARGHGACIVVRPADATYLLDPLELHGLDLLRMLAEFGFTTTVVVLGGAEGEGAGRRLRRAVKADPLLAENVRVIREPVDDLPSVLRDIDARLCFTEFPPDRRVLEAGKMFFEPRDFQPGLAGAVRSITRLVRLAESEFPRTWNQAAAGGGRRT